jgi:hypothetical protein
MSVTQIEAAATNYGSEQCTRLQADDRHLWSGERVFGANFPVKPNARRLAERLSIAVA